MLFKKTFVKLNPMLKTISNFFLDLFFPKKCLGCNKKDVYICNDCFDKIEIAKNNKCPFCDRPVPNTLICEKCREKHFLDRLIWAVPYSNPLIKELIKIFKYHYIKELARPLAQLLLTQCGSYDLPHNAVLMPIPLHERRLKERDFNQAELLAKEIVKHYSLPLETGVLKRKRAVLPQAKIKDHKTRKTNIKGIFEIDPKFTKKCLDKKQNLLKDKTIILIDDVTTTGATLSEAAKVLKHAGANKIWGLVVAKG